MVHGVFVALRYRVRQLQSQLPPIPTDRSRRWAETCVAANGCRRRAPFVPVLPASSLISLPRHRHRRHSPSLRRLHGLHGRGRSRLNPDRRPVRLIQDRHHIFHMLSVGGVEELRLRRKDIQPPAIALALVVFRVQHCHPLLPGPIGRLGIQPLMPNLHLGFGHGIRSDLCG